MSYSHEEIKEVNMFDDDYCDCPGCLGTLEEKCIYCGTTEGRLVGNPRKCIPCFKSAVIVAVKVNAVFARLG